MTAVASLAHAYHQRRAAFISEERIGDWRLKLYGLAAPDKGVRPELIETTRRLAAESLPPADDTHHGAAFAIAHDARFPIALVYWWADENELHHHVYTSASDELSNLDYTTPTGLSVCVWDLRVQSFERDAWVEEVLTNQNGPDVEGYMRRRLSADV